MERIKINYKEPVTPKVESITVTLTLAEAQAFTVLYVGTNFTKRQRVINDNASYIKSLGADKQYVSGETLHYLWSKLDTILTDLHKKGEI